MKNIAAVLFFIASLLGAVSPAAARDMGDSNLLIPIAARTPGAFGTQWQTDLVITNLEPTAVRMFVTLHSGPTSDAFTDKILPANGTLVLEDVLSTTLQVHSGFGMLRVNSPTPGARFTARAYVYNRGTAGEFGQGVPAVPVDALGQEHVLSGLAGVGGKRSNLGIANPWSTESDVILTLRDANGELLGQRGLTVAPRTVVQLNDAFAQFGAAPAAGASVHVLSSVPVYPYASVVRNDTGDAIFIAGTGIGRTPDVLAPVCGEPAPLIQPYGGEEPAEETTVQFNAGTIRNYIEQVAVQHGFTINAWSDSASAISAVLTPQQIAAVRCDTAVKVMRRDGVMAEE